jgi:excisionase family DNA binding protein
MDGIAFPGRSIRLTDAAQVMSCSTTTIRRLLAAGELQGHTVGRAVRVYLASIEEYQRGRAIERRHEPIKQPTTRRGRATAAHHEACATLHKLMGARSWNGTPCAKPPKRPE